MPRRKVQWIGLGTAVARATTRAGLRPCKSCERRKLALNRWAPRAIPILAVKTSEPRPPVANPWKRKK